MRFREEMSMAALLFAIVSVCFAIANADLIVLKADRKIDLTSHIVRVVTSLKVENNGPGLASQLLFAFPPDQAENLSYLKASAVEGKGKNKVITSLVVNAAHSENAPEGVSLFSISLGKNLNKGENVVVEVVAALTHSLKPFPEEISQTHSQLVLYRDSAYLLSSYEVKLQSLTVKTPNPKIESYTKVDPTTVTKSEMKYGPYENIQPFSFQPFIVHFENNNPFATVKELVREIEISHWGNVQVVEHYHLVHQGARLKGGFSRIDYQVRNAVRSSSLQSLMARLPARAHSVYYRDEIGNISTSHLRSDSKKTELEIEPRYPMFGGWHATFTIGYGLPLQDFVYYSPDGRRYLNYTFGSPFRDVVIENIVVRVALPEGSRDTEVSAPFFVEEHKETKYSYLDTVGRPVVVLSKKNVVPEQNVYFQVYYNFNIIAMLAEPLMLITVFSLFFATCIIYSHFDFSISKSSASYLENLQKEEVVDAINNLQKVINSRLIVSDKLESSLRDLARTGELQTCKAVRKSADATLKDTAKELKSIHVVLQRSPQAIHVFPKVEELIQKEREKQEKLLLKASVVIDSYERKLPSKEIDARIAPHEQKLSILKQEVEELLRVVDEM